MPLFVADLAQVKPFLEHYGLIAVFLSVFLESIGGPTPSESVLFTASLLSTTSAFWLWHVILSGWAGAALGGLSGYIFGRYGGRPALLRYGHYVYLTRDRLEQMEDMIRAHGMKLVLGAQFFPFARQLKGIAAGAAGMTWPRFFTANLLGTGLWALVWAGGAHIVALFIPGLGKLVHEYALLVFLFPFLLALVFALAMYLRGQKTSSANLL